MMCGYWDYDCKNTSCILYKSSNRKYKTEEELIEVLNTRKPLERIVEKLEEASFWTESTFDDDGYSNDDSEEVILLDRAIKIVEENG